MDNQLIFLFQKIQVIVLCLDIWIEFGKILEEQTQEKIIPKNTSELVEKTFAQNICTKAKHCI